MGSPLRFLSVMKHCPLLLVAGVRVHNFSVLIIDEVKSKADI
jgi:hypothetical protein